MHPADVERLIREAAEREQRRQAEDLRDQYIRIYSGIYEKASAYTQGIIAVSYAAVFGVWAFVRDLMSPRQEAAAGLLLLTSVLIFTFWEVGVNVTSALRISSFQKRLIQAPQDVATAMQSYQESEREANVGSLRLWAATLIACLLTGCGAVGTMAWSLGSRLLCELVGAVGAR
jgi:hypothetical protein